MRSVAFAATACTSPSTHPPRPAHGCPGSRACTHAHQAAPPPLGAGGSTHTWRMVGLPCGQFQGARRSASRPSTRCISSRLSARPIMMDERHARLASMARTLRRRLMAGRACAVQSAGGVAWGAHHHSRKECINLPAGTCNAPRHPIPGVQEHCGARTCPPPPTTPLCCQRRHTCARAGTNARTHCPLLSQ